MNKFLAFNAIFTSLLLPLAFASNADCDVTYHLMDYATEQSSHHLSGSVTTVETAADDGLLAASEILNWQFSISGPDAFSSSSALGGTAFVDGTIRITDSQITIEHLEDATNALDFSSAHNQSLQYVRVSDIFGAGVFDQYSAGAAWQSVDPRLGGASPNMDPWVLATSDPGMPQKVSAWAQADSGVLSIFQFSQAVARIASVPEPNSHRMLCFALLSLTVMRRRQTQRTPSV